MQMFYLTYRQRRSVYAPSAAEDHAVCQRVRARELSTADLLAVGTACAQHFDRPALRGHAKARLGDVGHFADLAAHVGIATEGVFLRVEDLDLLAVQRGPRARRRIAAADHVVDEIDRIGPVDLGFGIAAPAFVARLALVLNRFG